MFFVIMPRVSAIPHRFDNPEHPRSGEIPGSDALDGEDRSSQCDEDLLSAGHANYDGGNVFRIDECVEIFGARQIRKVDDMSVTCATLPPSFSPDRRCSSTPLP